jgi:hypothetical protein
MMAGPRFTGYGFIGLALHLRKLKVMRISKEVKDAI